MTIETINVGLAANDGTGDDLREAMIKINNNFTELDIRANQTGANLGSAGTEVYKNSDTNTLYFRRLLAGTYISLVQNENSIVVNNSMPLSSYAISTNSGSITAGHSVNYNIIGADAITVSANENTKTITVTGSLQQDTTPVLGASLDANNFNITNVNNLTVASLLATGITSTNFTTTNISGVNFQERLGRYITGFDFGNLDDNNYSILDWVINQVGVDFGSFVSPTPGDVDLGGFV